MRSTYNGAYTDSYSLDIHPPDNHPSQLPPSCSGVVFLEDGCRRGLLSGGSCSVVVFRG